MKNVTALKPTLEATCGNDLFDETKRNDLKKVVDGAMAWDGI